MGAREGVDAVGSETVGETVGKADGDSEGVLVGACVDPQTSEQVIGTLLYNNVASKLSA